MLVLKVKIGRIDTNGYCGRLPHPRTEDQGQEAEVVGIDLQRFNPDPIADVDIVKVKMSDGRIVDLVEHEISLIWMKR